MRVKRQILQDWPDSDSIFVDVMNVKGTCDPILVGSLENEKRIFASLS